MATDNPSWGYTRIQGALTNVGHRVARSTVASILKAEGIPPSRERPTAWRTFLRAHWVAANGAKRGPRVGTVLGTAGVVSEQVSKEPCER